MAFTADFLEHGSIAIIVFHGYLDQEASRGLRGKVEDLLAKGVRGLVFDLADAPLVSSGAMGDLVDLVSKTLTNPSLEICFCGLSETVNTCFQAVGLALYASVAADRTEALARIGT